MGWGQFQLEREIEAHFLYQLEKKGMRRHLIWRPRCTSLSPDADSEHLTILRP